MLCACEFVSDLAFRTDKAAHVLHHSNDWQLDFLAKSDLLSHILQGHFLERETERERERERERAPKQERRGREIDR